ncbi:MAG: hypothetical protein Q8P18_26765 [Pseudomonadota bacterium]|nr:hypothetical protein [Pseudomonadota bacterium]
MRLAYCALLAVGCGGQPSDTGDGCDDLPVVNWASFGEGFMREQCGSCHSPVTANRYGAPEDVHFETADEVWAQKDAILVSAASAEPTMPPGGGATEDDRTLLRWWLECAPEGT